MAYKVLVLPGDHVGPEIIAEAVKVLKTIEEHHSVKKRGIQFEFEFEDFGGSSIDKHGVAITEDVLKKAEASDAVLFGSVGGPKWGAGKVRPEQGVLELRKRLNCWANIRPCKFPSESLESQSVLKPDVVHGTDFIVLRENCGGAYFGPKVEEKDYASDTWGYSRSEVERITRMAGYLAKKHQKTNLNGQKSKIISCDKANVLAVSRLWREVVQEVCETEFKDVELVHQLADSATVQMMKNPLSLTGIVLCDNTFGDILSDEAAVITGSLGLLPSASLSAIPGTGAGAKALYEPSHGSAPDLPRNAANPVATILSAALMLRYSFDLDNLASTVEKAVAHVLDSKDKGGLELRTGDIGGKASTTQLGDAIANSVSELLNSA